ncbi:SET and MYND domain-containing protein 4 [Nasonia vitripennis]|uniref:SET and MYND domain-containing protein 4 n=1 Tax=Nasonia vitripennis TaxID=7425 RepID=A0A7M7G5I3_NASVI|nr:SET and MYND domain-containing protein 4 [Nasonia vitripennis]
MSLMNTTMDNDIEGSVVLNKFIVNQLGSERSQSFMKENLRCTTKCLEKSRSLRKEGNDLYVKKLDNRQMEKIFKLYTESIAYAPNDSKDLALAFGNRSALLYKMNKYKESIIDIDRALALTTSDWQLRVRLLCRKAECLAALGSSDCKKVYKEAVSLLPKNIDQNSKFILSADRAVNKFDAVEAKNIENQKKCVKITSRKKIENPIAPAVNVQYDENYGKHLVAARDIKPGEIICVDKLYVSCLNLNNFHAYCDHCFTKSWVNIPCDSCNWCMFCSEECKKLAWMKYHDFECTTVSYLLSNHEIDYYDRLSLRSLLKGIRESGSISKFKVDLQSADKCIDENGEILQSNGFKGIFSTTQCRNIPTRSMQKCVINSAIVLIILSKYTAFFGSNHKFTQTQDLLKNEDVLFVGSMFLKIRKSATISTHLIKREITDCKYSNDFSQYKLDDCFIKGACLTPIHFYIKHSCYPNTKKCITNNQEVIVFALEPIEKDSPLFMSYHGAFYELEKPSRQSLIKQNMSIICQCIACEQNWPTLYELYKMPKEKPLLYAKTYNRIESELFDENNALVKPILNCHEQVQYNQATLKQLTKAMEKALKYLEQPSVVISELMICLEIVYEKLANSDLLCCVTG